jgi:MFS transporter, DHA1 family, multidrug resistance protein
MALGQLFYGPIIECYGRKGPLLVGVAIFVASSILLAMAPSIEAFIVLRFLQAIGGCAGMIVGRAIINDLFEERDVARMLSMMMLVIGVAPILAPLAGGIVMTYSTWHMIFVLLAAFGACCGLAALLLVPETLPPARRRRMGPGDALRSYGRVLSNRRFLAPTLGTGFAFSALFSFITASPFVYMEVFGLSPQMFGLVFGVNATSLIISSQLNRVLLAHFALRHVLIGASTLSVASAAVAVLFAGTGVLVLLVAPIFFALGCTPIISANSTAIAMQACRSDTGSASAIIGLAQFGFAAAASGVLGLVHQTNAYPMTGAVLIFAFAGWTIFVFGVGTRPKSV